MNAVPAFKTGDRVKVQVDNPPHHVRTPAYVQGRRGEIERYCGAFANPEQLANGDHGLPTINLYRVRFSQAELWQPSEPGAVNDSVDVEIFEHWLQIYDERK